MYLISFGTRPELIKLIPLINTFKSYGINYITLFTGQHETLIQDFYEYINEKPTIIFKDVMEHNQTLNMLLSKIMLRMDGVFEAYGVDNVIVQGDTTTAYGVCLSAFHRKIRTIHIEAGLRTYDKYSPYPEEINRRCISQIADIHFCPTELSYNNLLNENVDGELYLVGNTIVDSYKYILNNYEPDFNIKKLIGNNKNYYLITLHRRENRGSNMNKMWNQLNILSSSYKFVYIYHPSVPESKNKLVTKYITILEPQNYINMVYLINNCRGLITDSGGIAEEATCAHKKILICRNTTERQETINCGLGKLVDCDIINNINFLDNVDDDIVENPYGNDVCEKIIQALRL